MAKPVSLSLLFLRPATLSRLLPHPPTLTLTRTRTNPLLSSHTPSFSTTSTPFPLQYDLIINRPTQSSLDRRPARAAKPDSSGSESDSPEKPDELGFDNWLDQKLDPMEKKKRKYYNKRRKRMYGGDSEEEEEKRREGERLVELKPEVVEFNTLHKREEELYFYDTFAYPWEKDKHYKMVYQLEKKYYPDQCLDKAFLEPGAANCNLSRKKKERGGDDDKGMVFFEGKGEGESREPAAATKDVAEKKVEEFFKCLKKVPKEVSDEGEPYLLTRSSELPPRWDGPFGTVVLVNKPKGIVFARQGGRLLLSVESCGA